MIYSFPPYYWVLVVGSYIGVGVLVLVFFVMLIRRLSEKRDIIHEADGTLRFAAFWLDIFIINIINTFFFVLSNYLSTGNTIYLSNIFLLGWSLLISVFEYILSPIYLILGLQYFSLIYYSALDLFFIFLPYIICYLYFVILDSVFKGNTLGRLVFRIKLRNVNNRTIKFHEILVNNLGKSFFFLADLIIGSIVYRISKIPEGFSIKPHQIRLMQRLSGIIMVRIPKQRSEQ